MLHDNETERQKVSVVPLSERLDRKKINKKGISEKTIDIKLKYIKRSIEKIGIKVIKVKSPITQAINNYIYYHNNVRKDMEVTDVPDFKIDQIAVNFIKHELSSYRDNILSLSNKRDKNKTFYYLMLNEVLYSKIAQVYPKFAVECARQYNRKLELAGL